MYTPSSHKCIHIIILCHQYNFKRLCFKCLNHLKYKIVSLTSRWWEISFQTTAIVIFYLGKAPVLYFFTVAQNSGGSGDEEVECSQVSGVETGWIFTFNSLSTIYLTLKISDWIIMMLVIWWSRYFFTDKQVICLKSKHLCRKLIYL